MSVCIALEMYEHHQDLSTELSFSSELQAWMYNSVLKKKKKQK